MFGLRFASRSKSTSTADASSAARGAPNDSAARVAGNNLASPGGCTSCPFDKLRDAERVQRNFGIIAGAVASPEFRSMLSSGSPDPATLRRWLDQRSEQFAPREEDLTQSRMIMSEHMADELLAAATRAPGGLAPLHADLSSEDLAAYLERVAQQDPAIEHLSHAIGQWQIKLENVLESRKASFFEPKPASRGAGSL